MSSLLRFDFDVSDVPDIGGGGGGGGSTSAAKTEPSRVAYIGQWVSG